MKGQSIMDQIIMALANTNAETYQLYREEMLAYLVTAQLPVGYKYGQPPGTKYELVVRLLHSDVVRAKDITIANNYSESDFNAVSSKLYDLTEKHAEKLIEVFRRSDGFAWVLDNVSKEERPLFEPTIPIAKELIAKTISELDIEYREEFRKTMGEELGEKVF